MALLDSELTHLKTPPVAPGDPIVGSFRGLLRDPLDTMYQAYKQMGPVFRVKAPTRDYVVLAGPDANLFFLQHGDELLEGAPVYQPYPEDLSTDRVLVAMEGSAHRAYKKALKPGLSREALTPHLSQMADEVGRVARSWQAGDAINVPDTMQFFASQMMGLGLAGCPVDHHFDAVKKFAHTYLGAGVGGFPNFFRKLPAYQRAREAAFEFVRGVIEHHRENPPGKHRAPDLIDMLLEQTRDDGQPLAEMDLIASAHLPYTNSLVYAGALAGFMLYELLRHPDVLRKVREEADLLFADGAPDARALRSAHTLRGALMETQRLHPIALSIPRIVKESFEFEGYLLEKGTVTLTATAVTHLLPEYFPEPMTFDIERYEPPRNEHQQAAMFVPYGLGAHVCPGAGAVDTMIMLMMAALVHTTELALDPPDWEMTMRIAPFPAPAKHFQVNVIRQRTQDDFTRPVVARRVARALPFVEAGQLTDISHGTIVCTYGPGEVIVQEGAPADEFYIINKGRVEVLKIDASGVEQRITTLSDGAYFGEIGLLQGGKRIASVRAIEPTSVLVLTRETFNTLVAENDLTSSEIAEVVRTRMLATSLQIALPHLTHDQVSALAPRFQVIDLQPGTPIIEQGKPGASFYIIMQGEVEVVSRHPAGHDIRLGTLGCGEFFGEAVLPDERPSHATVRALTHLQVMALDRENFRTMVEDSEETSQQITDRTIDRLIGLVQKYSEYGPSIDEPPGD